MEYGDADFFIHLDGSGLQFPSFAALDMFPRVVEHLVNGLDPMLLGTVVKPQGAMTLKPIVHNKMIRASVIHVDAYQNLVLNIRKHEFEHTANGRNFVIQLRRGTDVDHLSTQYADVNPHELAAFFNTGGYLEVALNQGNIAGINNIQIGDVVQIDFD
jgi:S-adenosyl-L-methionine hydrolase (adenosine-forming)